MKNQKTSTGHVTHIKDSGPDLSGGAVERRSRMHQGVDSKSI